MKITELISCCILLNIFKIRNKINIVDNNNFIEKSQRERKDLLSQFLDITVFEQLYQLASDEIKETFDLVVEVDNSLLKHQYDSEVLAHK